MTEPAATPPAMSAEEIAQLMRAGFPGWEKSGVVIETASYRSARLRYQPTARALRPGGTIAGPVLFMLADTALYVALLASIGPKMLAVTTNVSINFLRKAELKDLIVDCRLLKLGKRLAVGDVMIFSDGEEEPVAQATGAFAIPA